MAQLLVELCTILVEEHFGERIASLWQHLADIGRTSVKDLLESSGILEEELTKHLSILILHNCVNYYTDEEYGVAYYTVDLEGTYNLLRLSRLIDVVRKRCGPDAAGVFANVAQFGHVTMADLIRSYQLGTQVSESAAAMSNGAGTSADDQNSVKARPSTRIKTIAQLHNALLVLLRAGFLIKAQPRFTQNPYDLEQKLEQQVIEDEFAGKRVTGPVSSRKFREAVSSRKRKQQEQDFANDELAPYNADISLPPYKRRKLTDRMANGHSGSDLKSRELLKDDLVLYVNSKKYLIALRSEQLEVRATEALGPTGGAIYGALLRTLEKQIHDIRRETSTVLNYDSDDDEEGFVSMSSTTTSLPKTTAMEITTALPPSIDYTASMNVKEKDIPKQPTNGRKVHQATVVDEDDFSGIGIKPEPFSDDDDEGHDDEFQNLSNRAKTFELLNNHLELLAEHSSSFCSKISNKNPPEWQVDFSQLTEQLLLAEIDMTISARFGTTTTRLVRLLRDKGKLEEKQISTLSFLPLRTVRALLTEVFASGFVDAQEVAKDNTRQPSKALYLWYFDFKKVRASMLQQCYQAICRAYQRMSVERRRHATVIEKAENIIRDRLIERRELALQGATDHDAYLDIYTQGIDDDDDIEPHQVAGSNNAVDEHTNGIESTSDELGDRKSAPPDDELIEDNDSANEDDINGHSSSQTITGDGSADHDQDPQLSPSLTVHKHPLKNEVHTADSLRNAEVVNEITDDERVRGCSKYVMSAENLSKDLQMSTLEKQDYRKWRNLETLFLGQIMKLDDLVVLLRDF